MNSWFSVIGLAVDFIGVALLGFDLVRLQVRLRRNAQKSRDFLDDLSSDYGGTAAWAEDIKRGAVWYPESSYSERHAEDEVSFNSRNAVERLGEVAECTNGLAEHVSKITLYLDQDANESGKTAFMSFWLSIVGLVFVLCGFALQLAGSWPQK